MTYYLISFFTMVQDDKTNNNNLFLNRNLKEAFKRNNK